LCSIICRSPNNFNVPIDASSWEMIVKACKLSIRVCVVFKTETISSSISFISIMVTFVWVLCNRRIIETWRSNCESIYDHDEDMIASKNEDDSLAHTLKTSKQIKSHFIFSDIFNIGNSRIELFQHQARFPLLFLYYKVILFVW